MKSRASRAISASTASAERRPAIRAASFSSTTAVGGVRRDARLVERRLQVLVRDERHAGRELRLGLRGERLGDRRVVLDAGEERRRQRRDEDRAGERGADRRAELRPRVLQAADLAALLVGHGGDGRRCRAARPSRRCPDPISSSGQVMISGPAPTSSSATSSTSPAKSSTKPAFTTRRGLAFGSSFGTPAGEQRAASATAAAVARRSRSPTARARPRGTAARRRTCPPARAA